MGEAAKEVVVVGGGVGFCCNAVVCLLFFAIVVLFIGFIGAVGGLVFVVPSGSWV